MVALIWLRGLVAHRRGRLVATSAGVAVAVALLASLRAFLSASKATMTRRAIADVAVDWQVEAQPGADAAAVVDTVAHSPGVVTARTVEGHLTHVFQKLGCDTRAALSGRLAGGGVDPRW